MDFKLELLADFILSGIVAIVSWNVISSALLLKSSLVQIHVVLYCCSVLLVCKVSLIRL